MAVALAAVVAASARFPLTTPALVEEWTFRWAFDRGEPWISPDMISIAPTRPLNLAAHKLARTLTPDSFTGSNVLLVGLLVAKGLAAAALLARLFPGSPAGAAAGAVLVALVPADVSLFLARDVSHHATVFLTLVSLLLYLRALERPAAVLLAAIALCQAVTLGIYESPFLLLLAVPFLFLLLPEFPRPKWSLLAVWYSVPIALALRAVVVALRGENYVRHLFAASAEGPFTRAGKSLLEIVRMAARQAAAPVDVAARSISILARSDLALAALAALLAALLLWRRGRPPAPGTLRRIALGVALFVLGALPFALAPRLRGDDRRVHLLAAVGAAVVLAGILSKLSSRTGALAAAMLVFLSVCDAGPRRDEVVATAGRVGRLVRGLAEGAPAPVPGALVLLLDANGPPLTDNDIGLTWTDVHVADALRVVHRRDDILFYVFGRAVRNPWNGAPVAGPDGVTVRWANGRTLLVPYRNVVAFRRDPDASLTRLDVLPKDLFPFARASEYAPAAAGGSGPPPPRLASLVPPAP
jgi:hypothetical protein